MRKVKKTEKFTKGDAASSLRHASTTRKHTYLLYMHTQRHIPLFLNAPGVLSTTPSYASEETLGIASMLGIPLGGVIKPSDASITCTRMKESGRKSGGGSQGGVCRRSLSLPCVDQRAQIQVLAHMREHTQAHTRESHHAQSHPRLFLESILPGYGAFEFVPGGVAIAFYRLTLPLMFLHNRNPHQLEICTVVVATFWATVHVDRDGWSPNWGITQKTGEVYVDELPRLERHRH